MESVKHVDLIAFVGANFSLILRRWSFIKAQLDYSKVFVIASCLRIIVAAATAVVVVVLKTRGGP